MRAVPLRGVVERLQVWRCSVAALQRGGDQAIGEPEAWQVLVYKKFLDY